MNIPDFSSKNCNLYKTDYLLKYYPDFYNHLITTFTEVDFKERLYMHIHHLDKIQYCPVCSKRMKFISITKGYRKCCETDEGDYKVLLETTDANKFRQSYIEHHYPKFYKKIIEKYSQDIPWRERLYMAIRDMDEPRKCKICGNYTSFINHTEGYQEYCSSKCANGDPDLKQQRSDTFNNLYGGMGFASEELKNKAKQTNIKRYGFEYAGQNSDIVEKQRQTMLERYGGWGMAVDELKQKYQQTMLERYGVTNNMFLESSREKAKQTSLKRYGVTHAAQRPEIQDKIRKSRYKHEIDRLDHVIDYTDDGFWICKCPHLGCDKCESKTYITFSQLYRDRLSDGTELCTNLLPYKECICKNTTLELFVQNILNEYNIEYETSVRSVISPKELDIYIPSKKLAIECNGIYWHSSKNKPNAYHINKFKSCRDTDIQMLSIWEDWIRNKPEIVRSIILSKLGIFEKRIGARQCKINIVDTKTANNFLIKNHIQGKTSYTIAFGLYYNDELVSVMTFGKKKACSGNNIENEWELNRFCTKLNMQVVGGAERLMKAFIKEYKPSTIVSFSMNDISNGNLYQKLGFESLHKITSSYWYIKEENYTRYHRSTFTKASIVNRGWKEEVNESWKEEEVMYEHGYFKICDSGITKWIYTCL